VRSLARLLLVVGAVGIGWFLFEASPRDVVLVYDAAAVPDATALEVEIRSGGDLVRRARLALDRGVQARHPVRLRDGAYDVSWRLVGAPGGPVGGARELVVTGDETIVLPLGR
jgi:hypothetical protein